MISSAMGPVALSALLVSFATSSLVNALFFDLASHHKRGPSHHALSQKIRRDPTLPSGWTYAGCYTDGQTRTLAGSASAGNTMTVESCIQFCAQSNYKYAGLEYSQECYCDNVIQNNAQQATGCTMMCAGDSTEVCGAGYRLSVYVSSNPGPAALPSYGGYGYQGCYTDTAAARSLSVGKAYAGSLTPQKCLDACNGYKYAALEYGAECYCDNQIRNSGALAGSASSCNMVCPGNSSYLCGGSNRLTLYEYGVTPVDPGSSSLPVSSSSTASSSAQASAGSSSIVSSSTTSSSMAPTATGWNALACYSDAVGSRTLSTAMAVTGDLTIEKCQAACINYQYAGVEYGVECYCGYTIRASAVATSDGRCNMQCAGNANEICGGPNGLNVFNNTNPVTIPADPTALQFYGNWTYQHCYSDDGAARTLPVGMALNGATTPQKCMDACYNAGYGFAGMEYANECYCGLSIQNGATPQSEDGCSMTCGGDAAHFCGGPNRLSLYAYNGTVPPPTGGGGGGGPGTSTTPVTTGLPTNWAYRGCWIDNAHGRIMTYNKPADANNTALSCINTCIAAGFSLAGLEYAEECWCSNSLINAATKATSDAQCNMACTGDSAHACGAGNRVSLYAPTDTFPIYPVPTVKNTTLPGAYSYLGCYAEPPGGKRVFPWLKENVTSTNVNDCLTLCSTYGYPAAALEFGTQCACGDPSDITNNGGAKAPETDCSIACVGSPVDLCGGVARLSVYTWSTSNPLFVWHTPANPGHYELLIGGIVIPLIATLGINNKVAFLEKFGTGAPNSTGAYELDPSLANDYQHAWREMHVSSDVFCAANLVLPDRSGRILSVGGWSYESTEGVRLYTPSGSPGVNGTTDWEEHWDYLHLQKGRWYPGAMVMANGSVLVVGGQSGSNGPPVPSLEILPKPDGGPTYLTMPWLAETDPNNLYPFLFVLPGGGIFVLYYNQAQILNEVDFSTVKTFPTVPGAVNAAGGRTYPMEGTSVMLPQHAPYTDPVEILTCGGSAFGQAFDNCVSIVPEGAGEWVIERMPSKRVMTIMTNLPGGEFLIMGGAQAGVAGFGLANTPNLQAILYDPTQPRHQRFSILASTTVARMYHSEAILLPDGRALITGSDPQDQINPQEYRMEVYVPSYLTDGRIQPSFTIQNRDWVYGGQYQITVTLPQGTTSTMRISILGAESSTHGGSFGQRTIFPAFTCAGNVCTITAPPNAHVLPPTWARLFVLDSVTPSHSQWIRIGGDPGSLGNWPNFPGFELPGMGGI